MGIGQAWLHCGGLKILRTKFDSLSTHNTTHRDAVLANHIAVNVINAPMGELADPPHLGCGAEKRVSSSLTWSTKKNTKIIKIFLV